MMAIIVQHEVTDFAKWKLLFDADETIRAQAGIKQRGLYTSEKNLNDVTLIFDVPNADVLEAYINNPDVQEDLKKADIIGVPDIALRRDKM